MESHKLKQTILGAVVVFIHCGGPSDIQKLINAAKELQQQVQQAPQVPAERVIELGLK